MTAPIALPAAAHGWQRMPDLDLPCATAWEMPNGDPSAAILNTAQNWVCDDCAHAWWEADAYRCPACGQSGMHLWGQRDGEST